MSYHEIDNIAKNGKYVRSKNRNSGAKLFDKEIREVFTDKSKKDKNFVPGPGQYEYASEFGIYKDNKW